MTMPPNWYNNPDGSASQRWWDGQQWTELLRSQPVTQPAAYPPPYPAQPRSPGFGERFRQDAKFSRNVVLAAIGLLAAVLTVVALNWSQLTGSSEWHDYGYDIGKSAAKLVGGGMSYGDACSNAIGLHVQFEGMPKDFDSAAVTQGCMDAIHDAGYP